MIMYLLWIDQYDTVKDEEQSNERMVKNIIFKLYQFYMAWLRICMYNVEPSAPPSIDIVVLAVILTL